MESIEQGSFTLAISPVNTPRTIMTKSKKLLPPTFPNPTIVEAICQIRFSPSQGVNETGWEGTWFGHFLMKLGDMFEMEPKLASTFKFVSSSPGSVTATSETCMLYRHRDKKFLFQLSPWCLTINELGRDQSWALFLNHIQEAWTALFEIMASLNIERIGLRYINRIPRGSPEEQVGEWLKNTDILPKRLLAQSKGYFFRTEIMEKQDQTLILSVAEEQSAHDTRPIILDLDAVSMEKIAADWGSLESQLEALHDIVRREFDHARTAKYTAFLNQS